MPDNTKYILDAIQNIVDKNKGYISMSKLSTQMNRELRDKLGVKSNTPVKVLMKKLKSILEEQFIVQEKGRTQYIMTPCDPEELVLAVLSGNKTMTQKQIAMVLKPLYAADIAKILTELVAAGRVRVVFNATLPDKFFLCRAETNDITIRKEHEAVKGMNVKTSGEYTQKKFRAAFDELHKTREFVRICDLRKSLNWPHDTFDEMVRTLRDAGTIQLYRADESLLTAEELNDSFMSENNLRMGTMIWNGR